VLHISMHRALFGVTNSCKDISSTCLAGDSSCPSMDGDFRGPGGGGGGGGSGGRGPGSLSYHRVLSLSSRSPLLLSENKKEIWRGIASCTAYVVRVCPLVSLGKPCGQQLAGHCVQHCWQPGGRAGVFACAHAVTCKAATDIQACKRERNPPGDDSAIRLVSS
jgi:hypothetical protein